MESQGGVSLGDTRRLSGVLTTKGWVLKNKGHLICMECRGKWSGEKVLDVIWVHWRVGVRAGRSAKKGNYIVMSYAIMHAVLTVFSVHPAFSFHLFVGGSFCCTP